MNSRSAEQAAHERRIFERFLAAYPSFAKDVVRYPPPPPPEEFPDIDAYLRNGRKVPVELGEWIDGQQLAEALKANPDGGAYDPEVALDAVRRIVEKKLAHYGSSARGAWLVIHYSRGVLYNTPFRSLSIRNFEDVARVMWQLLKQRKVYFDKVYLLGAWGDIDGELAKILSGAGIPFVAGPEAFEVFPNFKRCD